MFRNREEPMRLEFARQPQGRKSLHLSNAATTQGAAISKSPNQNNGGL
jgi:hypothetical protein